jgi:hypothetical protein
MARRGWIEKKDVINAQSLEKLFAGLRAKPGTAAHGKHRAAAASAPATSKSRRKN